MQSNVWRRIGIALGALLVVAVMVNLSGVYQVPHEVTLFLFGTLVAMGVGNTVRNPGASLVRLDPAEEKRFRVRQYIVGALLSILLGLTMFLEEVRNSQLLWLFLPIMALPGVLLIYEYKRRRSSSSSETEPAKGGGKRIVE